MSRTTTILDKIRLASAAALLLAGVHSVNPAFALDEYQYQVLFSPTAAILEAEARGRIMIYDRLEFGTVERALDQQFDRIENMMFVRTVYPQENGDAVFEEDGCD